MTYKIYRSTRKWWLEWPQAAIQFSSVQFSRSVMSDSFWPHGLQHAMPPCPSPTPRAYSNSSIESVMPSNHLILCHSLLLLLSIFPSIRVLQFFTSGGQNSGVSASTSVLPMNIQDGSPCSPRDSRESSPTPQFKSINSSALSFLYSPTLTSIHDHWKNHSLD